MANPNPTRKTRTLAAVADDVEVPDLPVLLDHEGEPIELHPECEITWRSLWASPMRGELHAKADEAGLRTLVRMTHEHHSAENRTAAMWAQLRGVMGDMGLLSLARRKAGLEMPKADAADVRHVPAGGKRPRRPDPRQVPTGGKRPRRPDPRSN